MAREIGTAVADRPELRRATRRADSESVTGIALAVALAIVLCGGLVLAVFAFLVRSDTGLVRLDRSVADWGQRHASPLTDHVLNAITFVGQPVSIGMLAALVALAETIRTRNRWIAPFMLLVIAGTGLLTTTVKELADRARPAFNPIAETLGPSFPSGHSSWSAAFLAATALILSRNRGPHMRAALAGAAAGLAVSVAATRVLLAMHWLSDVIAGLALGWAWFAVCAIAFGGRRAEVRRRRPESPPAGARRRPRVACTSARVTARSPVQRVAARALATGSRSSTRSSSGSRPNASATAPAACSGESWLISIIVVGTAAAITSPRKSAAILHPARFGRLALLLREGDRDGHEVCVHGGPVGVRNRTFARQLRLTADDRRPLAGRMYFGHLCARLRQRLDVLWRHRDLKWCQDGAILAPWTWPNTSKRFSANWPSPPKRAATKPARSPSG